jgi:predicted nucleotidyltransferase
VDAALAQRLRSLVLSRSDVDLVVMFGSTARGDDEAGSDLDLAVRGSADRFALAADLALALGREVDVVPLDTDDIVLTLEIVRDGQLVFEREPSSYAWYRANALTTLETDLPWLRLQQDAMVARLAREAAK